MENDSWVYLLLFPFEDAILESKHQNKMHCVGWLIFIYLMVKFEVMSYLIFNQI